MSQPARVATAAAVVAVLAFVAGGRTRAQPNPFRLVPNWTQLPDSVTLGNRGFSADPDPQGTLWALHAGDPPLLRFDRSGKLLASFGRGMYVGPHGLHVDAEGNIWVTDCAAFVSPADAGRGQGYQVFKLSPAGAVLMTLGTAGVSRAGRNSFICPSDVAVAPNGDVFVADGHDPRQGQADGDRVVKFSSDGTFVTAWGRRGSAPGEFAGPHGIALDSRGRVFVADRSNNRVQIFDGDGRFIDQWKHFGRPSGIHIDRKDALYVADSESNEKNNPGFQTGIRIGHASDGSLSAFIPGTNQEGVTADVNGNVYAGADGVLRRYVRQN
jgi:DNA-binding beta-propeller fold protein YncE